MKKILSVFKANRLIKQIVCLSLISFNYAAIASDQISEAQILRVAKIAKTTGTSITIVKETTTVKVTGSNKKTNKKVRKTVLSFMKLKKQAWQKLSDPKLDVPELSSEPRLDRPEFSSASLEPGYKPKLSKNPPPELDQVSATLHPPVLNASTPAYY